MCVQLLTLLPKTDVMLGVIPCIAADESQGTLKKSALGFLETLLVMRSAGRPSCFVVYDVVVRFIL